VIERVIAAFSVNGRSLSARGAETGSGSGLMRQLGRVAAIASRARAEKFAYVSGIRANTASDSPYIRSRGEGDGAVLRAFPAATLIRPAVMFGPDDAFLVPLCGCWLGAPARGWMVPK
jgi:uncharacterized protein YbjT (DUF2867 family)